MMNFSSESYDVVVCGGGLAGFCAAVASARHGAKSCLVQDRPVLGGNASSEIRVTVHGAAAFHAYARETGILSEILIEERARNHEEINENGAVIAGKRLDARNIIWTAGVEASPAGKWIGAETDRAGRARVNGDLSVPGHPNIFVIGDTASASQNGKPLPGVAPVAMQEGRYVASVIADAVAGQEHQQPFHYVDKGNLATVGRFFGIIDIGKVRLAGFLAWVIWLVVHIYYLIGFRNRFMVMFQWGLSYLLFQRSARLIAFEDYSRLE